MLFVCVLAALEETSAASDRGAPDSTSTAVRSHCRRKLQSFAHFVSVEGWRNTWHTIVWLLQLDARRGYVAVWSKNSNGVGEVACETPGVCEYGTLYHFVPHPQTSGGFEPLTPPACRLVHSPPKPVTFPPKTLSFIRCSNHMYVITYVYIHVYTDMYV